MSTRIVVAAVLLVAVAVGFAVPLMDVGTSDVEVASRKFIIGSGVKVA